MPFFKIGIRPDLVAWVDAPARLEIPTSCQSGFAHKVGGTRPQDASPHKRGAHFIRRQLHRELR